MHNHSLWKNWDTIIDTALTKLQEFYILSQQHGPNGIRPEIELIERNKTIGRFDFYNQWLRSFENWLNSELIKKFSKKKFIFTDKILIFNFKSPLKNRKNVPQYIFHWRYSQY